MNHAPRIKRNIDLVRSVIIGRFNMHASTIRSLINCREPQKISKQEVAYALICLEKEGEITCDRSSWPNLYTYTVKNSSRFSTHAFALPKPPSFCLQPSESSHESSTTPRFSEGDLVRRVDKAGPPVGVVVKVDDTISVAWAGQRYPVDYSKNTVLLEHAYNGQTERVITLAPGAGTVKITYTGSLRIEPI